jgi:hypothetical protein
MFMFKAYKILQYMIKKYVRDNLWTNILSRTWRSMRTKAKGKVKV